MGFIDHKNRSTTTSVLPQKEIRQSDPKFLFIQSVKRQGKVIENRLQQPLNGWHVRVCDHRGGKRRRQVLRQPVANERLSGARSPGEQSDTTPLSDSIVQRR